ncbi:amidohydrolase [Amedibacterium intestinale]|uniref:Amidohydrolase n=1 Tax=Amedibacterium intestinale TaxID=2583452 RepID=A0A6N4TDU1_9FIRM|nr:amidohydrolase [Amedibacterium intestinale]BBK21100.1 amidohydrolase [Amedibacterium intestinale]
MLIKNGKIYTMENREIFIGDIRILDGHISEIGAHLEQLEDEDVLDATNKYVYPGLVEAHCHLGMEESSIRMEGNDVNESSDPVTPHVRAIDGCNPMDETIRHACEAGVTTVAAGPGSANVIGGTFMVYKTYGNCIDDMVIKNPVAMKCAFGENPKRVYQESKIKTRMNIAALLRETLYKTKEYMEKKESARRNAGNTPAYDMRLEAMIPVLKKEIPLKCHAHRADDILTIIRIAKEFDIDVTLDHCTDGEVIKEKIKESGYPAIVGPALTHKSKFELANKSFTTPKTLMDEGVLVAITTDSPVIPQEYLSLCAGLAMKAGMEEIEALEAITINPAKILGLDNRLGSLKAGKDADIVICDGSILDSLTKVDYTIINGKVVYKG